MYWAMDAVGLEGASYARMAVSKRCRICMGQWMPYVWRVASTRAGVKRTKMVVEVPVALRTTGEI